MDFPIDEELLEAAAARLEDSIAEYNERLGYLGADWHEEVRRAYDEARPVSFRVYFEDSTISYDVYFDVNDWNPDDYLWEVAGESLAFSVQLARDGQIEDPLPESIEITF